MHKHSRKIPASFVQSQAKPNDKSFSKSRNYKNPSSVRGARSLFVASGFGGRPVSDNADFLFTRTYFLDFGGPETTEL